MKIKLEEATERLNNEFQRVAEEAQLKYGTSDLKSLKDTSGHDSQQARDREALVHQMETYLSCLVYLHKLEQVKSLVNMEGSSTGIQSIVE